jgi:limonene-1,2-epoxide hydrolase
MVDEALERNLAVVRRVCLDWDVLGRADWHELLTPDCDYRNIPVDGDRHVGPDAVHDVIAPFGERWQIEATIVTIAAMGDVVLTERVERFIHRKGTKPTFDLPVMGAFELRDGRIAAWRDYFELSQRRLRG